jgi:hypothetical protein
MIHDAIERKYDHLRTYWPTVLVRPGHRVHDRSWGVCNTLYKRKVHGNGQRAARMNLE